MNYVKLSQNTIILEAIVYISRQHKILGHWKSRQIWYHIIKKMES